MASVSIGHAEGRSVAIMANQRRPSASGRDWYIVRGPRREGPYSQSNVVMWLEEGIVPPSAMAVPAGSAKQKPLAEWPEFSSAIQRMGGFSPPTTESTSIAPASVPFKLGEKLGLLRKKLPGLKKEAGDRLGSLQEKVSKLRGGELVARLRRIGKVLFGILCWLLIEGWAVCVATKDQTVRLLRYAVSLFPSQRRQRIAQRERKVGLWPTTVGGWTRIGIGYGVLLFTAAYLLLHNSMPPGTAAAYRKSRDILREASSLVVQESQDPVKANGFFFPRLAARLVKSGDTAHALKVAGMVNKEFQEKAYARALEEVAVAQAEAGQIHEAFVTSDTIPDRAIYYASVVTRIALCEAKAGNAEKAKKTLNNAVLIEYRSPDVLQLIVSAQAEAGFYNDANKTHTLLMAAEKEGLNGTLAELAFMDVLVAEAKQTRKFSCAVNGVSVWKSSLSREHLRGGLVPALVEAGKYEEALSLAETSEFAWSQIKLLGQVAAAYGRKGRFDESARVFDKAAQVTERLPTAHAQASALAEIAGYQRDAGNIAGAGRTLERALQVARLGKEPHYAPPKSLALVKIAIIQHKVGNRSAARTTFTEARQTVEGSGDQWDRKDKALAAVGNAMVVMDGATAAISWSRKQNTPYAKACALLGTAEGLLGLEPSTD